MERLPRVNRAIKAKSVRVIDGDGKNLGIFPLEEALKIAEDRGLDLIEVAPNATPPVCKIIDFGKFKYELRKKAKPKKKEAKLKEVRMRPSTDKHDFEVKVRSIVDFLEDGNKVKVNIRMKRREVHHPGIAKELAKKLIEMISDSGTVEKEPSVDGKSIIFIVAPKRK